MMKKRIWIAVAVLALALAAAAVILFATGILGAPERQITWTNMGDSGKIPCVGVAGGEYAVDEDFRYVFRKANDPELSEEWGTLIKNVRKKDRPIDNIHYGEEVYLTRYVNTNLETFQTLLEDMQYAGFSLYARSSISEDVHTASLTYQNCNYTVTLFVRDGIMDVTASDKMQFSPYLQPENDSTGAAQTTQTTLRILEPRSTGSGCIIQLKNGNFVIFDGGNVWDTNALLECLEENTPEGQIPVVEAWFITAADYDRSGWVMAFLGNKSDMEYVPELFEPVPAAQRLVVNGIYYNKPAPDVISTTAFAEVGNVDGTTYYKKNPSAWLGRVEEGARELKTQAGEETPVYRPMAGQVYYFSGLTVEVLFSHEKLTMDQYDFDIRNANTSYMIRSEDKAVLNLGSAGKVSQEHLAKTYGDTYWKETDMVMVPHYGRRLFDAYKDVFKAPVLYFEAKGPDTLSGEAAEVAQYYADDPNLRCYWHSDGDFCYTFLSGEISATPRQPKS